MPVWKTPPKIKIYEALGCLADERIKINGNSASVKSSSGNKSYTVTYDPETSAIMANDNGSYWQGYLGYPSIAYLLSSGRLKYDHSLPPLLKNIPWKDLNQQFKNNWEKTEQYCQNLVVARGGNRTTFLAEIERIYQHLEQHPLPKLGARVKPPPGY